MIINPYAYATGGGGATLYDEVMADSPLFYFQMGEASGTTAVNAAGGTDGAYFGGYTLGNAALYAGGPTSYAVSVNTGRAYFPGASMPATMNEMTMGCVFRPSSVTGLHHYQTRDRSHFATSSARMWQWLNNGANMSFTKITGGTATVNAAHGMTAGTAYIAHARVTSGGVVTLFVNGASIGGGTIASANYGGAGDAEVEIGNRATTNEGIVGDRYSDAFLITSALSDARILAHAQAAGFA